MFTVVGVICCMSVVVSSNPDPYNNNLGVVVFSHVVFRHGDRMPLELYPSDPYQDFSYWPFKLSQLTDIGKQQEYRLGKWLLLRYGNLLSKHYDPDEVYVQSTDVDRTIMSAQCAMAGLYKPTLGDRWHQNLAWQPIPVHTVPAQEDCLLGASSTCPCLAYKAEVQRALNLPEIQALQKKFEALYNYVSNHTGREVRDFSTALKVYDELAIEEQLNMTLPDWTKSIYPEPIREAGLYSFVFPTWTTLQQRLKIGPLLKDMTEHFQAKIAGTLSPDRRLWIYSAHDSTISAILNTFKVFDIHFPPYTSCVLLELRRIREDYFVTLLYRNTTEGEPLLLPMKNCNAVCPLEQFLTLVKPLIPEDWAQECQPFSSPLYKNLWHIIVGTLAIIGYIIVCISTVGCLTRKSSNNYFTMPPAITDSSKDILV